MTKKLDVELLHIQKSFGANVVVDDFNLEVEQGECISFLGPSGCGKTTTLNMIAGFLEPDGGELRIKGKRMNGVPSNKRDLGMVFQTYSLFPHMTVEQNVAYGLKLRKVPKPQIRERVQRVLEIVKLPHVADRYPKQLSGGQRQRIAIARALVTEPSLLLLDEPLSNLDAKLREELRDEIKRLHQEIGVTTIFVTHDQEEALYLSDRIVVISHGKIEQIGTPWEIYNQPATEFVHTFIGKSNQMSGKVQSHNGQTVTIALDQGDVVVANARGKAFAANESVSVYVRPEKMFLDLEGGAARDNRLQGTVQLTSFLGSFTECVVNTGAGNLSVRLSATEGNRSMEAGRQAIVQWEADDTFVFARKES
ncbi:ABC transporter ATP-binding protein [Paenibacillus sp. J2TS4]|uniref:ABC transporter ATP-binding protein n=1 Tax=Paenibacillus sp. J2TS4 TaxID=2807194 RepID=UPI001B2AE790|nr:ABC transporter ATP-binding protein [Paenibacillus sp. J2TS4]GIP34099.1 polyamine-transporting ATPase [Paenibacillus sp. J2TS4]